MSILYLGRYEFKMLVEMARMVSKYRYGTGTFDYFHVVLNGIFNRFWRHFHAFLSSVFFSTEKYFTNNYHMTKQRNR